MGYSEYAASDEIKFMTHAENDDTSILVSRGSKKQPRGLHTGMKSEDGFEWRRPCFDDLDYQPFFVGARFFKRPDRSDMGRGIPMEWALSNLHAPRGKVAFGVGSHLPILHLTFSWHIAIALCFYEKLRHLERVTGMGVEVEISFGIKRPVEKLKCIGTRDERVGSGLERPKRDGIGEIAGEMAVDIERASLEFCNSQVDITASQSESNERAGRETTEHEVVNGRASKQPCIEWPTDHTIHERGAWENPIYP